MIGIIGEKMDAFILVEEIRKKYPKCDIYICNNSKDGILKLKDKCQIIILLKKNIENINENNDLYFIKPQENIDENYYLFDTKEIINAINEGDNKRIRQLLNAIIIPENVPIFFNSPKLLLIKSVIGEIFPNEIKTSLDYLLVELEIISKEKKLDFSNNGITNIIY